VTSGNGALNVKFKDEILNEDIDMVADLVVLATGLVPNSGVNIEAVPLTADETATETARVADGGKPAEKVISILNLTYRRVRICRI